MTRILSIKVSQLVGKTVTLAGWVNSRRDHGKIIFIDLRDRHGLTQVVFLPGGDGYETALKLRPEWVVEVSGEVVMRPKSMENPKILSGTVEVKANEARVISQAKNLPFEISDTKPIGEELRLKYRYLDLRSPRLHSNLKKRQLTYSLIRRELVKQDFIEIETPYLTKSTPEGARDYIVPSRLHPGDFYALPQSPQQYKQLLMVAGLERYFQIVRCFRDEDTRGDRQPEFTQLDLELSFSSQQEILSIVEQLMIQMVAELYPEKKITLKPFPRFTYAECQRQFQNDRPDLRKNRDDPNELAFLWVTDFPMFEYRPEEKRWFAVHHPFTAPDDEFAGTFDRHPDQAIAKQYDLVLNGFEIGGGSIRIHQSEILKRVFKVLGYTEGEVEQQFGHLIEAFKFGVPPHGGIALGLDRLIMILQNEPSIREVIAFPKTGDGRDLMMNAPSKPSINQLKELGLSLQFRRFKK